MSYYSTVQQVHCGKSAEIKGLITVMARIVPSYYRNSWVCGQQDNLVSISKGQCIYLCDIPQRAIEEIYMRAGTPQNRLPIERDKHLILFFFRFWWVMIYPKMYAVFFYSLYECQIKCTDGAALLCC